MKNTEVSFFFILTSHLKKTKMIVKSHVTRQSLTQSPADQKTQRILVRRLGTLR